VAPAVPKPGDLFMLRTPPSLRSYAHRPAVPGSARNPYGTVFSLVSAAALLALADPARVVLADPPVVTANPVLFVTQTPAANFGSVTAVFGNHPASIYAAPRGGDLVIRYPDGTLRSLTAEAGYGNAGMQGAGSIAVREPCVHWNGQKALFSMVVGAPTQQYQLGNWRWQIYEVSGLGQGQTAEIRKIAGQPSDFNNVSPIYATDGRVLFTSDRPRGGEAHLYPQRDEYESAPIVAGIYALDEQAATLELLEHAPSGATSLSLDSFGRVIFTKWDHLQRDQQGDAPSTAMTYQAFTWSSEAEDAAKTTSLAGAEVFPEPRTTNDPSYSPALSTHSFNHFLPWEMNEDGTAEETLNHIGRQEIGGAFTDGSFKADSNLSYFTPDGFHANQLKLTGSSGLFHLREDPSVPGDFLTTYAQEFGTASGGVLLRLTAAPSINADQMLLTAVTPTSASANVPTDTGYFRNPLPMTGGAIVASHTAATGYASNLGSTEAPNWNYAFRLKLVVPNGPFHAAGPALTTGIVKTLSWWTPDALASWTGALWELDPVEVVARPVPVPRQSVLPAIEAQVFAEEGVDVEAFRQYLRDNELALIVSRNVTQRDRSDVQQPFNLQVPGGVSSIPEPGTVYDVSHLQIFQADAVRGYGPLASPYPGRRLLARPMHGDGVSQSPGAPSGGVTVASDGSIAALVPARRALTWQLTDPNGNGVVRERNWISFQSGEIRVCANCHGVNTESQTGEDEPENEPEALHQLLAAWALGGGGGGDEDPLCASGVVLQRATLKATAAPFVARLQAEATLALPWTGIDPAANGVRIVVDDLFDATLPGGADWTTKASGWTYRNDAGPVAGVTRVKIRRVIKDDTGRLLLKLRAAGAATDLPSAAATQATIVFGNATECASIAWNGPGAAEPRCEGDAAKIACR
jgi:hypothetical protein